MTLTRFLAFPPVQDPRLPRDATTFFFFFFLKKETTTVPSNYTLHASDTFHANIHPRFFFLTDMPEAAVVAIRHGRRGN